MFSLKAKRITLFSIMVYSIILMILISVSVYSASAPVFSNKQNDWDEILGAIFDERCSALLSGNAENIKTMYTTDEKKSRWALEHEENRIKYLKDWAEWRGIRFTSIKSNVLIKKVREVGRGYAFRIVVSTTYTYFYEDQPDRVNLFRIGTYHSLDLIPGKAVGSWVITREWYSDPLQDPLIEDGSNTEEVKQFILAESQKDFSGMCDQRIRALEYADRYAGAASDGLYGYDYNPEYPNFNYAGGDCSNYVSQILHESGFKTNSGWNYTSNAASRSWCNAVGLQSYLIWSGKAYALAQGTFGKVYKASYDLMPGDVIAYLESGRVDHMCFVSGTDSKGYPLVNSHTADRYHVPWDLGWNEKDIKYILMRVNYPS